MSLILDRFLDQNSSWIKCCNNEFINLSTNDSGHAIVAIH